MKKFEFTLEKVLAFKQQLLDVKIGEKQALQKELHERDEEIARRREEHRLKAAEYREKAAKGISAVKLMQTQMVLQAMVRMTEELLQLRAACLTRISEKQQQIVALKSDISGLEKLRDKQKAAYRKAESREQQNVIDEYVQQSCVTVR